MKLRFREQHSFASNHSLLHAVLRAFDELNQRLRMSLVHAAARGMPIGSCTLITCTAQRSIGCHQRNLRFPPAVQTYVGSISKALTVPVSRRLSCNAFFGFGKQNDTCEEVDCWLGYMLLELHHNPPMPLIMRSVILRW